MKKVSLAIILLGGFVQMYGQTDSIYIDAKLSNDQKILNVNQKIVYHNRSDNELTTIKLLNWVSAYKNKGTQLVKRKLEDRNSHLHFAKDQDLPNNFTLTLKEENLPYTTLSDTSQENLFYQLKKPLLPGEKVTLDLAYALQLPNKKFTGYGTSQDALALKYFFLVPDHFDIDQKIPRDYLDTEESVNFNTYWKFNFEGVSSFNITSNLTAIEPYTFQGFSNSDPEFVFSKEKFSSIKIKNDNLETEVKFGYALKPQEKINLEFYLPLQLNFLKERIGTIPKEIFISDKFRAKEDFFGNNDIKFWKYKFKLFTDAEQTDLDYFGIIAKKILDEKLVLNTENYHWFKNGIKSYLEIEYLKKFYKETKLLGNLPENKIFGIKPLKFFHASKVKLIDCYGLAYQYIMSQNLDQKITEKYSALSNFNDMAISGFEMGTLFQFSADKIGKDKFNTFLQNYLSENTNQETHPLDFLQKISLEDPSNKYLAEIINHKHRINFNLRRFKNKGENLEVQIHKNTDKAIPVLLQTETKTGFTKKYWVETEENKRTTLFTIPADEVYKITLNNHYAFPENNFRDNYLYTKGFFANTKKIKLKLIKDIPNPEFLEVYLNPRVRFSNTYDKFLLGLNIKNQSLVDQKFLYSITPSFSTGTGKITGSGAVSYTILPPESIFRSINFGVSGSYFHYDYDLSYRKGTLFTNFNFRKDPRSTVSRGIFMNYNYFERDLSKKMIAENDYSKYNIWSLGYGFSDNQMINEKSFSISTQGMEDFNKVTAEAFYRWEFAPRQKLSLRLFAGYFLRNNTRNNTFDFGISRVPNYSFSYNLLGESASSGVLLQQFVLADGGFKSFLPGRVNHWITSFNVDSSVWKIFHVYADAGVYKNKHENTQFIWDSGIKLRVIPDFLEVYFPIQSSLGFEPGFKDYAKRIRYTLVLNLNTIINAARRGWY